MSGSFEFWHAKVTSKGFSLDTSGNSYVLHISGVCLGPDAKKGRTVLCMNSGEHDGPIAALTRGGQENHILDIPIGGTSHIKFSIQGPNTVYLNGYKQPLELPEDVVDQSQELQTSAAEESMETPAKKSGQKRDRPEGVASSGGEEKRKKKKRKKNKKKGITPPDSPQKAPDNPPVTPKKTPESPPKKSKDSPETTSKTPVKKSKATPGAASTDKKKSDKKWKTVKGGTQIRDLKVGSGKPAKKGTEVTLKYVGTLENKEVFDKNLDDGITFEVGSGSVVAGFDKGTMGLCVGGKRRIKVPASQGYGDEAQDGIPANSVLTFTVQRVA